MLANINALETLQAAHGHTENEAQEKAPPKRGLGQKIADGAGAANNWMGRNVGLAVPDGREFTAAASDPLKTSLTVAAPIGQRAVQGYGTGMVLGAPGGFASAAGLGKIGAALGGAAGFCEGVWRNTNRPIGEWK